MKSENTCCGVTVAFFYPFPFRLSLKVRRHGGDHLEDLEKLEIVKLSCSGKQICSTNFPLFSMPFAKICRCITRNNVSSFPCCRVTLFNPHYSKHLSFPGPPSLLIPLPPPALSVAPFFFLLSPFIQYQC